ncbi:FAD-dependent monooxygenase [Undibacterium fentianense]|uniref:FAD-dependent monooxygenase n=1 Tax=Undibacterium fentianense TaxID=2828728 RepID=A0A941E256_9BURK|nr:FAD-dependent monooxygenase [Undibacterium fentianense]MBR7799692.1 FAD-dependent monooxygenase [Undibacterium fentianense]
MKLQSFTASSSRIAICGAGPVGQALALMLYRCGVAAHDMVLFDAKTTEQASHDARSIALSFGSEQLLKQLGAPTERVTAIEEIHVSRRKHFGRSLLRASDYALPALGYVARYGDIVAPLEAALNSVGIQSIRPALVEHIEEQNQHVLLHLQDGRQFAAEYVIQAEGGTFAEQEQGIRHHDYQQTALIAHVTTSHPLAGRAFERFTEQGPLALLPQDTGYALVWCMRPSQVDQHLAMGDQEFLTALQIQFGDRLGQFIHSTKRVSFALGLNTQASATRRTVRIGNAAQTLHPVAGQGLNLGLRDAIGLAQFFSTQMSNLAVNNDTIDLHDFLNTRRIDRQWTIKLTDTMARIFASSADGSLLQSLLGLGLCAIDLVPPLKQSLAEQMMYGARH